MNIENLYHVKFKNGEDIVGINSLENEETITIKIPVLIKIDPHLDDLVTCSKWNTLSDDECVRINKFDTLIISPASSMAKEYFSKFIKILKSETNILTDNNNPMISNLLH